MRLACYLLAACSLTFAQSDPITGAWKGSLAQHGSPTARSITLDLKFDGTSAFTGTATAGNAIPIKTGTFDPKSGVIRFQVEPNGPASAMTFEGLAIDGTAIGHVTGSGHSGDFKFTRQSASSAAGPVDASADLRRSFTAVSSWVSKAADLVPADKYAYRPAPGVRTFGELVAHLADSYAYECSLAIGAKVPWSKPVAKGPIEKPVLLPLLKQAADICATAYNGGEQTPLVETLAHTNLHYGNMITYMRMLGITPPSTNP